MIKQLLKAFHQPVPYQDDYIELMRRVNAGMLHQGNIACFDYAVSHLPSGHPIVEIGTFCGLSANVITYFKKIHQKNNLLVSTDKLSQSSKKGIAGRSHMSYEDYWQYVRESLLRNTRFFSRDDPPYLLDQSSDDFFNLWQENCQLVDLTGKTLTLGGPVSFAYIDGNHHYEQVKKDFEHCDHYLEKDGFILFDDSADFSDFEVKKVIREVKKTRRYRVIMKNPNYLFQKIK